MLVFVDRAHFKNSVDVTSLTKKISTYEVTNMPTVIGEFLSTMR